MKKRSVYVYLIILVGTILLNVISRHSTEFVDWYMMNILPVWVNTYGCFMGLFPFSVGEFMLIAGVVIVLVAAVLGLICLFLCICRKKCDRFGRFCRSYYLGTAWIALGVFVVMTLNCFICYHGTDFAVKYFPSSGRDYTFEELCVVRDYVVEKCNQLAGLMERDANGNVIYSGDMEAKAVECMQLMGQEYEQLAGFYPRPKEICFSEFLSQQYMQGYFFSFSMEANYNRIMCIMNKPATMCHEMAHLKGFMKEDEANLIGYLACINSDDPFFQYSGYLSVLNYLDNDFYDAVNKDKDMYLSHVHISPQVRLDNKFLSEETWEVVEKKSVISTETVDKISDEIVEVSLVMNGVEDGMLSYCRVVGLLLDYYSDRLEGQYVANW